MKNTARIALGWLRRALVPVVGLAVAGCGGSQKPAVEYNQTLTAQDAREKRLLSPGDKSEIRRAFRTLAQGESLVDPPGRAPYGVRWADVAIAVGQACDELGVEMVVVETMEKNGILVFRMRTVEDWPARLEIHRVDPPQVYVIEDCRVGRFYDEPEKVARCEKLKAEFEKKLKKLGKIRWFNEDH